jgi:hypothetical protein
MENLQGKSLAPAIQENSMTSTKTGRLISLMKGDDVSS